MTSVIGDLRMNKRILTGYCNPFIVRAHGRAEPGSRLLARMQPVDAQRSDGGISDANFDAFLTFFRGTLLLQTARLLPLSLCDLLPMTDLIRVSGFTGAPAALSGDTGLSILT